MCVHKMQIFIQTQFRKEQAFFFYFNTEMHILLDLKQDITNIYSFCYFYVFLTQDNKKITHPAQGYKLWKKV